MFKPPKMFHLRSNADVPPPPPQPAPEPMDTLYSEPEEKRVWSPEPTEQPIQNTILEPPVVQPEQSIKIEKETQAENISLQETTTEATETPQPGPETPITTEIPQETKPIVEDFSRYARPKTSFENEHQTQVVYPTDTLISQTMAPEETTEEENLNIIDETENEDADLTVEKEQPSNSYTQILNEHQKVVRAPSLNSIPFADIWYTAEKIAYIRDKETPFALIPFETDDMEDFYKALEQGYTGQSSYAIRFAGESYRVERIITLAGVQYNCRKMPGSVPDIYSLGLPKHIVDHLLTLGKESGLLLFGGPTGMGKTTSASALMKKFLEIEGGFMYTIEDPPEMPLEGLYRAKNGGLGLCKQCPVDNERWGDGIKSALRSRPRYILVGEIRTPETASQVLRAATSGHLVLSTIHASTVEDALESLIKYASGAGLTESLAADLLARGILGVIHQKLEGSTVLRPVLTSAFANPHLTGGDQMRSLIRNNTINLQTLIEAQSSRMMQGRPIFGSEKLD